jgi:hypothetical protein
MAAWIFLFGKVLRRTRAAIPAGGVSANLLMVTATQQVVDGLTQGLPDDIPASEPVAPV